MADVMITCPETNEPVPTGMSFDDFSRLSKPLAEDHYFIGYVEHCPRCGGEHPWRQRDAFFDS